MKLSLLALFVIVFLPGAAPADDGQVALYSAPGQIERGYQIIGVQPAEPARYDAAGTKLVVLTAFAAIDYGQSAGFVTPGGGTYELNPVLKDYPSRQDMLAFGVLGMGLLYLSTEILPEPWATIALDSAVASEQYNIEDNVRSLDNIRRRMEAIPIIISIRF